MTHKITKFLFFVSLVRQNPNPSTWNRLRAKGFEGDPAFYGTIETSFRPSRSQLPTSCRFALVSPLENTQNGLRNGLKAEIAEKQDETLDADSPLAIHARPELHEASRDRFDMELFEGDSGSSTVIISWFRHDSKLPPSR